MYITITDVMGGKRIDLAYPIWGREVAIVSMFSDNIQYQIQEPLNVLLITSKEKLLLKEKFTGRELSAFVGRNTGYQWKRSLNGQVGTHHRGCSQLEQARQH